MLALETPFVIQIISARVRFNFFFRRHTTLLRALRDYSKNGCVGRGLLRRRQTFSYISHVRFKASWHAKDFWAACDKILQWPVINKFQNKTSILVKWENNLRTRFTKYRNFLVSPKTTICLYHINNSPNCCCFVSTYLTHLRFIQQFTICIVLICPSTPCNPVGVGW